jgi:hypothetical protein
MNNNKQLLLILTIFLLAFTINITQVWAYQSVNTIYTKGSFDGCKSVLRGNNGTVTITAHTFPGKDFVYNQGFTDGMLKCMDQITMDQESSSSTNTSNTEYHMPLSQLSVG